MPLTPSTVGAYTETQRLLQLQIVAENRRRGHVRPGKMGGDGGGPRGARRDRHRAADRHYRDREDRHVHGTSLDTAAMLNAQVDVAAANALTPTCGYVTTPAVAGAADGAAAIRGTDRRRRSGSATCSTVQMLGMKAMSLGAGPGSGMIFGDLAQVIIGEWGVLELSATNPSATPISQGHSRRCERCTQCDVAVRHAGAFSVATSIT